MQGARPPELALDTVHPREGTPAEGAGIVAQPPAQIFSLVGAALVIVTLQREVGSALLLAEAHVETVLEAGGEQAVELRIQAHASARQLREIALPHVEKLLLEVGVRALQVLLEIALRIADRPACGRHDQVVGCTLVGVDAGELRRVHLLAGAERVVNACLAELEAVRAEPLADQLVRIGVDDLVGTHDTVLVALPVGEEEGVGERHEAPR